MGMEEGGRWKRRRIRAFGEWVFLKTRSVYLEKIEIFKL